MAEWSNATDSSSVPFGGAGSNPAGHITRKVYSKHSLHFKPLVVGSSPTLRVSSCSSVGRASVYATKSFLVWIGTLNTIRTPIVFASLAQFGRASDF